jgi:drug/metabolite transporter (DMT)-like permease
MAIVASLLWLPFILTTRVDFLHLPPQFYIFFLLSVFGEVIYMLGLARSYKFSDISYVYPVVRALPVLLIAAITLIFDLGKRPGYPALAGMVIIVFGCLMMPLASFRDFSWKRYVNKTILFILLGSCGTTLYTIFDSRAIAYVRESMGNKITLTDTLAYLFMMEFGLLTGELLFVLFSRKERELFKELIRKPLAPIISGIFGSVAYALILLAMGFVNNVSYIQAFRQMSLPIGFFAGVLILKEKASLPKLTGLFLIVAGLVMISLFR